MIVIKCKSGNIFSAVVDEYADLEWKFQEMYYKAQGCIVETVETFAFNPCECDHCKTLKHKSEELFEELSVFNK